jgi:hypothetical protein
MSKLVFGNLNRPEVDPDTKHKTVAAMLRPRDLPNCKHGCKALLRIGEEGQQRAVFALDRNEIPGTEGSGSVSLLGAAAARSSLVFFAGLGALAARTGVAPVIAGAWRVTFWGALAMALTADFGGLFGTAVG